MIKGIIKFIVAFALVSLLVQLFPTLGQWFRTAIIWLLSLGHWGAIAIFSLVVVAIFNLFE
jgi:hypothetical protein